MAIMASAGFPLATQGDIRARPASARASGRTPSIAREDGERADVAGERECIVVTDRNGAERRGARRAAADARGRARSCHGVQRDGGGSGRALTCDGRQLRRPPPKDHPTPLWLGPQSPRPAGEPEGGSPQASPYQRRPMTSGRQLIFTFGNANITRRTCSFPERPTYGPQETSRNTLNFLRRQFFDLAAVNDDIASHLYLLVHDRSSHLLSFKPGGIFGCDGRRPSRQKLPVHGFSGEHEVELVDVLRRAVNEQEVVGGQLRRGHAKQRQRRVSIERKHG